MPQKRIECFRLLLEHPAWIEHQFLNGIRDSRKAGSLWGTMRGVGGVRKSEHQIKNFMDKDCRVSIKTMCTAWCLYAQLFGRNWKCGSFARRLSQGCSEKIRKEDNVMTAGRWSSWSIQIPQFLILWWSAMKVGSSAITQRPRDRVPSWSMLVSQTQEGQPEQIHPQTFDDPFFFTPLVWPTCTGFPQDRESTRNTMLRFKGVQVEIRSEEASTLQIGSVAFPAGQCTSPLSLSQTICQRWASRQFLTLPIVPPYSPDLAPCDFCLFPKHKEKLWGCRYETIEAIHGAFQKLLER